MSYLTGAQATIETLRMHGVDTIFGLPGNHILPLYEAIYGKPGMRHILARHEQGAGFMAEGYARASGRIGVALTITGPGVTNITTPAASAYADSIPLLIISSSLARAELEHSTGALHEVKDQLGTMKSLVGWARTVNSAQEIPAALGEALRVLRYARPRAAYVQIPYDTLEEKLVGDILAPAEAPISIFPDKEAIATAARLLRVAKRPLIIAGNGVTSAGANDELARLAEFLAAPVVLGSKSHDVLSSHHPLVITSTGYDLVPELLSLITRSDATLVVGSKLAAERTAIGKLPLPAPRIQIDIDPTEIGRRYPIDVGIVGDAGLALKALLETLSSSPGEYTLRTEEVEGAVQALRAFTRRALGDAVQFLDSLRTGLPPETIIVADMTMLGYASARYLPIFQPRTFIHPVEFCTIGCGLPLALGAKAANPHTPVVTLCGDGGFLLTASELATAIQEKLDVIIVLFNDHAHTAVKKTQLQQFAGHYLATDLVNPDFLLLAQAFGARGRRVYAPGELSTTLQEAIQSGGTYLIEVVLPAWPWYGN